MKHFDATIMCNIHDPDITTCVKLAMSRMSELGGMKRYDMCYDGYYRDHPIAEYIGDAISFLARHPYVALESGWEHDPVISKIIDFVGSESLDIVIYTEPAEPDLDTEEKEPDQDTGKDQSNE